MIWFGLHGFLGLPADMEAILPKNAFCPNVFSFPSNFVDAFVPLVKGKEKKILVGYSMGGRLALQVLARERTLFDAAVIISANPFAAEDPAAQLKRDVQWGERFLKEPWEKVVSDWEGQKIFEGSKVRVRREEDFDREQLARALDVWSLARQKSVAVEELPLPILWITGGKDGKYTEIASRVSFKHPLSRKMVIPGAGHRVINDEITLFKNLPELLSFL